MVFPVALKIAFAGSFCQASVFNEAFARRGHAQVVEINEMGILCASMRVMACPAGSADNRYMKVMVEKAFIRQNTLSPVTGIAEVILIRAFRAVRSGKVLF
jgi:hypothetical protein